MKKQSLVLLVALAGVKAIQLEDISLNQRKLFAANHKVYGGEVQITDMDHADDPEYEMNRVDLRLMALAEDIRLHNEVFKSSLDDPASDATVTVVPAHSEKEQKNQDWLAQKPSNKDNLQLQDLDNSEQVLIENDFENEQLYPNEIREKELNSGKQELSQEEQDREDYASTIHLMTDSELDQQEKAEDKAEMEKQNSIKLQKYYKMAEDQYHQVNPLPEIVQNVQVTTDEELLE